MSSFFSFFKPAPYLPEIEDKEKVSSLYRYWRIRILYSIFVGYSLFYFTRKSFTFAMPGLIADLGYTKAQLGMLASMLSVSYGVSKFASGIMSDRSNPRYFMAAGLMLTGVVNILFGLSSSLVLFSVFWVMNGWFQGFGWPPCARFLTHWYSHSERGSWWSTWNVSHNVGAFSIYWLVGVCLYYGGWRWAMYVPGIICIFGSLFLINRLRDTPQSLGLPSVEKYRNDGSADGEGEDQEERLSTRRLLFDYVLSNKYIWLLAFAYFFIYVVRTGIDWTVLYLIETQGYSQSGACWTVSFIEVGGFFGNLCAGWSSDHLFKARRGPVNVLFTIGIVGALFAFWFLPGDNALFLTVTMFLLGFTIFGPQMLIGLTAAELSHKNAAATATGFIGLTAYLGSAVAGYPLGMITQEYGWQGYFYFMIACSVIALSTLVPLWSVQKRQNESIKESSVAVKSEPEYA